MGTINEKNEIIKFLRKDLELLNSLDLDLNQEIEKNNILININLHKKKKLIDLEDIVLAEIKDKINFFTEKIKLYEEDQNKIKILNDEFNLCLKEEIEQRIKIIKKINYNKSILENKKIKLSKNYRLQL